MEDEREEGMEAVVVVRPAVEPASPQSPQRRTVRIVIDCDEIVEDAASEAVLVSVAAEATQAVRGRLGVVAARVDIGERAVEVYRA